jgi:RimK family alpha-L-glutamate ligase
MRLAILSSGLGWHVQDLLRAATKRGIEIDLQDFRTLHASIPTLSTAHRPLPTAYLVRTMPAGSLEQVIFRMDVLHAAESAAIPVFNPPRALECCIDKYLTTQRLAAAGLPVPRTWCGQRADDAMTAYQQLGGDVVIKPLFGSEGRGIVRVSDSETAWRVCHAVENTGGALYLQEFIEQGGWDVRAFVLGDRVLAAMKRYGRDWRTNIAQGGRAEPFALGEKETALALAAARAVGCPIAGVDLLLGSNGWLVLEVNGVPGWRALSMACDIDVAGAVLDFIAGRVRP